MQVACVVAGCAAGADRAGDLHAGQGGARLIPQRRRLNPGAFFYPPYQ